MKKDKIKFLELCLEYRLGVVDMCTCTTVFAPCTCGAEKRYKQKTGNILFKEDDGLHTYVKVGEESAYAEIDASDPSKDIFLTH